MEDKTKICQYCKEEIFAGDKRVHFTEDYNNDREPYFDISFHAQCWIDKYAESVDLKVKEYAEKLMAFAKPAVEKAFLDRGMLN